MATTTTTTTTTDPDAPVTTAVTAEGDVLLGDTNLDGNVSLIDAVLLNKKIADVVTFNDQQTKNADCYMLDGEINGQDAVSLLKFLTHIIDSLPDMDA